MLEKLEILHLMPTFEDLTPESSLTDEIPSVYASYDASRENALSYVLYGKQCSFPTPLPEMDSAPDFDADAVIPGGSKNHISKSHGLSVYADAADPPDKAFPGFGNGESCHDEETGIRYCHSEDSTRYSLDLPDQDGIHYPCLYIDVADGVVTGFILSVSFRNGSPQDPAGRDKRFGRLFSYRPPTRTLFSFFFENVRKGLDNRAREGYNPCKLKERGGRYDAGSRGVLLLLSTEPPVGVSFRQIEPGRTRNRRS